ncbi:MAG: hypothetical protein AAF747_11605 [Planctomycetota bacterium]
MAASMTTTADCPRCGYDLGGEVAAWDRRETNDCPLRGMCSECGYEFAWRDVLNEQYRALGPFVEHARGWRSFLWRSWKTLLWVLWPPLFWKRVQMHHRVRVFTAWKWAVLVLVIGLVVGKAMQALMWPAIESERANYQLQWTTAAGIQPPALQADPTLLAFELAWPFAALSVDGSVWSATPVYDADVAEVSGVIATCMGLIVSWPILMWILSESRRRAKLRFAHVLRATAYPFAWASLPLIVYGICRAWDAVQLLANPGAVARSRAPASDWAMEVFVPAWAFGLARWTPLWWCSAIVRSWKLHGWGAICPLPTITSWLAAPVFGGIGRAITDSLLTALLSV